MIRWRVYYEDMTFSDEEGTANEAPAWGVLVIAQVDPDVGRFLQHGADYYWYDGARWYGGDLPGVYDYLLRLGVVLDKDLGGFCHAWIEDGIERTGDILALHRFMARSGLVKFGRHIPNASFEATYQQATIDTDFPPKSSFHWREKRPKRKEA